MRRFSLRDKIALKDVWGDPQERKSGIASEKSWVKALEAPLIPGKRKFIGFVPKEVRHINKGEIIKELFYNKQVSNGVMMFEYSIDSDWKIYQTYNYMPNVQFNNKWEGNDYK